MWLNSLLCQLISNWSMEVVGLKIFLWELINYVIPKVWLNNSSWQLINNCSLELWPITSFWQMISYFDHQVCDRNIWSGNWSLNVNITKCGFSRVPFDPGVSFLTPEMSNDPNFTPRILKEVSNFHKTRYISTEN